MNKHFNRKDRDMTEMSKEVAEAVQDWADAFLEVEGTADRNVDLFRKLAGATAVIRDAGYIGGIECDAINSEADALVTKFRADLFAFHARLTAHAKDAGIDLPPRQRSGGR